MSLIHYSNTGDGGKTGLLTTISDGTPFSLKFNQLGTDLTQMTPMIKTGDVSLYFKCQGNNASSRTFNIDIYTNSKQKIEFSILDEI